MATPLIISTGDFLHHRMGSPSFDGFVWDKTGFILRVSTTPISAKSSSLSFPLDKIRTNKYTSFMQNYQEVTISLVDIGNNDVLYDEQGNFISTVLGSGSGKIKIKKYNLAKTVLDSKEWKGSSAGNEVHFDFVDLKDVTLSAQAYSNIFTHIVSLMKDVDMAKYVSNNTISVEIYDEKGGCIERYGAGLGNKSKAFAYYNPADGDVTAVIDRNNLANIDTYSTLWNVQNTLGAHEIRGHAEKGWNTNSGTHHLVYAFQMGHPSWKNTTSKFKKLRVGSFWDYVSDYQSDYRMINPPGRESSDVFSKNYRAAQKIGFYPPNKMTISTDSISYLNNLIEIIRKMH